METEYQELHSNGSNLKRINKILIILLSLTCLLLIGITILAAISISDNKQDMASNDDLASFSPTLNPTVNPTRNADNTEYCPRYPIPIYLNASVFDSILQKIDTFIQNVTAHLPGFTATIVYNQQQIFTKGYGKVNYFNNSSRPPNSDDLVEIGSITKVFTSLLTYYLRDQNMLTLNDPITKYLPNFSIKSNYNTNKPLTLRQLLSHSSGLQRDTPQCPWHSINCNESKILETLSNRYLILPQYSTYHYSNLGFALLGRSIEKLFCNGCYENILKKYILNGLNFSKLSGFNYSDEILKYVAIGTIHDKIKGFLPAPRTTLSWISPTGGLLVTANDMTKLIKFLFRNNYSVNNNTNNQILDGSTINEILSPQILLGDLSQVIGLPFEMTFETFNTSNGIKSVWFRGKQGALSGFRSSLMLIPEYKLGVFTNALYSDVWDDYVWTNDILHMILPVLDNELEKYSNQNLYVLPTNYKLLIGDYKCQNETNSICGNAIMNINKTNGRLMMNKSQRVLTKFDQNVDNVLRVYKEIKQTCVHLDASDAELIYFNFENGNNMQATSLIFMEGKYKLLL